MSDEPIIEKEMVVVHSNESHAWQWNPDVSEQIDFEQADGNIITVTRPKEKEKPDER
jgi:hypothetical protein